MIASNLSYSSDFSKLNEEVPKTFVPGNMPASASFANLNGLSMSHFKLKLNHAQMNITAGKVLGLSIHVGLDTCWSCHEGKDFN